MSLQGNLSIERMCHLAQVSRAGFYRSLQEQQPVQEEMEVRSTIQQIVLEHRRRYGYRRVTAELRRRGLLVNHKRVARLMREDNLLAVQPRAFVVTTDSHHEFEVYLNLASKLKLTGINQLWVADITYIRLQTEFVYLAVILDGFSRKVVVHHSDRGLQYASNEYVQVLQEHKIIPSMSRPANPYDNASCESFMKTLKREEIYANTYVDLDHLRTNIEAFIEQYYNRCRLHSALGYQPPAEFEQQLESAVTNAGATMSFFRHGEDYRPDDAIAKTKSGPQTAPLTIGFDESPAGYSLASCSPAELASASPAIGDSERTARV
jgi:putative transposase